MMRIYVGRTSEVRTPIQIVFLLCTSSRSASMKSDHIGVVNYIRTEMVRCFVNFLRYNLAVTFKSILVLAVSNILFQ